MSEPKPPSSPPASVSLDTAHTLLDQFLHEFFLGYLLHLRAEKAEADEEFAKSMDWDRWWDSLMSLPLGAVGVSHTLTSAPPGIRKSRSAAVHLAAFVRQAEREGLPHRFRYLLPTHRLGDEVEGNFPPALAPAHYHGADEYCTNEAAAETTRALGFPKDRFACGLPSSPPSKRCPDRLTCPWWPERASLSGASGIVAYNHFLFGPLPPEAGAFALTLADEDFTDASLDLTRFVTLDGFIPDPEFPARDPDGNPDDATTTALRDRWSRLHAATEKIVPERAPPDALLLGPPIPRSIFDGFTIADLDWMIRAEGTRKIKPNDGKGPLKRNEIRFHAGMSRKALKRALEDGFNNTRIHARISFLQAGRELLGSSLSATGRAELAQRLLPGKRGGLKWGVALNIRRDLIREVAEGPLLYLDATANPAVVSHSLPDVFVRTLSVALPSSVHIHQRLSKRLGGLGISTISPIRAPNRARRRARERILRTFAAAIAKEAAGAPALVISYLEIENFLRDCLADTAPNIALAHFGELRGRNDWRHVRYIWIIGRPEPPVEALVRRARALTGLPIMPEVAERDEVPVPLESGGVAMVRVRRYRDPDLEANRAMIATSEIIQAIGRGRPFDRGPDTPLDVYVCADVIVPGVPLASYGKLDGDPPAPERAIKAMIERGAVLLSPADAHRCYPEQFPTMESAKKALQRAGGLEGITAAISGTTCLEEEREGQGQRKGFGGRPSSSVQAVSEIGRWRRVRYRPHGRSGGRGQQVRLAWFDLALVPDPRAWLEAPERLGPLAFFEIEAAKGEAG